MRTKWTDHAKEQRRQIVAYIRKGFGVKHAQKFMQEVDDIVNLLMHSPNIGQIDTLFTDRPKTYRSVIINGLTKMVYHIDDDIIYIVSLWDTRREPMNQAAKTE